MGDDPYDFEIAIPNGGGDNTGAAQKSGRGGDYSRGYSSRRYGGSSDGSSGVSLSGSDEDESAESIDVKKKPKPKQQQAQLSARGGGKSAATSSSSSALDKAKNFLSKYSTKAVDTKAGKTPQSSARRSSRVELSLDDSMDLSPDEEDDDEDVRGKAKSSHSVMKPNKTASNTTATSRRVSLSDSEDYGVSSYDDDDDEPRAKQQPSVSQKRPVASKVPENKPSTQVAITQQRKVESSAEEEEEEDDAVASFMDESEEGDPPLFSTAISSKSAPAAPAAPAATKIEPRLVLSQVFTKGNPSPSNAYNEVESNSEEEESIASKSDYVDSFEEEDFPATTKTPATVVSSATSVKPVAAASESGVYEEEDFDEESGVAPIASAASQNRITSTAGKSFMEDSAKSEPNFDYSMDFSDDNGGDGKSDKTKLPEPSTMHVILKAGTQPALDRNSPPSPPSRSDASGGSDRSEFLDFDRSVDDDNAEAEPALHDEHELDHGEDSDTTPPPVSGMSKVVVGESATTAAIASDFTKSDPETRFAVDVPAKKTELRNVASEAIRPFVTVESGSAVTEVTPIAAFHDASQALNEPASRPLPVATASTTRSRVLIVREYQLTGERVEMKDASTQFTGNHAAVQADFTPDGMHNLVADPPTLEARSTQPSAPLHTHPQPSLQNLAPVQGRTPVDAGSHAAAPPPPAPILSSPGYSMDALRLPSATTTSIYKQQLLALQEQILVKKRETERLVHERMTFQYSTLRGTERVSLALLHWIGKHWNPK